MTPVRTSGRRGCPRSLHCRADHRPRRKGVATASVASDPPCVPAGPSSGLLALDDLGARDLVVQGLALVVPERPQTVEQEDDEVDAADERHELDRGEQASTDGRDDVEGARGVSTTDTDAEDHLAGSLRGR